MPPPPRSGSEDTAMIRQKSAGGALLEFDEGAFDEIPKLSI
jgi:hypothetical protein